MDQCLRTFITVSSFAWPTYLGANLSLITQSSVWNSFDEVQAYINSCDCHEYNIYGVIADWKKDTIQGEDSGWHDLLRNADLVKL